jgi:hypothetical protein
MISRSVVAPIFAERLMRPGATRKPPKAHAALAATIEMLEVLKSFKPEAYDHFMSRTRTMNADSPGR